jgi:high-affinity iron transporter
MLINTVLLFLQSALPIFIIISLLLLRFTATSETLVTNKNLSVIIVLAISLVFLLSQYMEITSQLFDGKGTELIFSFGFILIYFCSALLFLFDNKDRFIKVKKTLALVVFLLVFSLHGLHFILYLTSYWAQSSPFESSGFEASAFESLFIGIILAVGICVSFAILLYFLLRYSDASIHIKTSCYFLLFFATGQLMQSIVLLQQVDVLPLSSIIWNSTSLIAEKSELGQLFRVLFGYETTPSFMQLITYLTAFIVPVFISKSRCFFRLAYGEKS